MKTKIKEALNRLRTALQKDPIDHNAADEACRHLEGLIDATPMPVKQVTQKTEQRAAPKNHKKRAA